MTKTKLRNGYKEYPVLVVDIFSDEVVKMNFLLQCLYRYLCIVVSGIRYLPRGNKENVFSIAIYWECKCVQIGSGRSNYTIVWILS